MTKRSLDIQLKKLQEGADAQYDAYRRSHEATVGVAREIIFVVARGIARKWIFGNAYISNARLDFVQAAGTYRISIR